MTFEYRDPATGDRFAAVPLDDTVWVKTTPNGCAIPASRIEELVAGTRDAARQATDLCELPHMTIEEENACHAARQTTGQDDAEPTLRDRLRRAICEAEGFTWDSDMLEPDEYGDHADAVLQVLGEIFPLGQQFAPAVEPQDHPGADLPARLRAAGEDHDSAQALIYAHARMTIREHTAIYGDEPAIRPCSCGVVMPHTFCPPTWDTGTHDDACTEDFRRPICHPRHTDDCPYTDPAVGQPAETPHTDEARPPRTTWRVEGYDADEWNAVSCTFHRSEDAHARKRADTRYPDMPTRVVRETTTWTVEDKR